MNKTILRNTYLKKRMALSPVEKANYSAQIANALLPLPIWNAVYYSLFLTMAHKHEVDTEFILALLHGKDKEVCVPKTKTDQTLEHYLLTDNSIIKTNAWGIPEPQNGLRVPEKQIEVVFIPLLAFDVNGQRLGYGKGMYDRFLAKCTRKTLKIGLSFFKAAPTFLEIAPTDIPLDYCVTPNKTYSFKNL